jgi:hypothetical protein
MWLDQMLLLIQGRNSIFGCVEPVCAGSSSHVAMAFEAFQFRYPEHPAAMLCCWKTTKLMLDWPHAQRIPPLPYYVDHGCRSEKISVVTA